jgi:hypothetical protein
MDEKTTEHEATGNKPAVTLPGTVEKIIPPIVPSQPEKAQIAVEGADHLYREIRVENKLHDETGNPVKLKEGAAVEVTIEADPQATTPVKQAETQQTAQSNPPQKKANTTG